MVHMNVGQCAFLGTILSTFVDTDFSFYPVLSLFTRVDVTTWRSPTMTTMNTGDIAATAEPDTDAVRVIVRSIVCGIDTF